MLRVGAGFTRRDGAAGMSRLVCVASGGEPEGGRGGVEGGRASSESESARTGGRA